MRLTLRVLAILLALAGIPMLWLQPVVALLFWVVGVGVYFMTRI